MPRASPLTTKSETEMYPLTPMQMLNRTTGSGGIILTAEGNTIPEAPSKGSSAAILPIDEAKSEDSHPAHHHESHLHLPVMEDPVAIEYEGKTVSNYVEYCYGLNGVIGVGVLSIPWAFYQAGFVLSIITLFLVTVCCIISTNWLLEVFCRATAIEHVERIEEESDQEMTVPPPPTYEITTKKFELTELCGVFLGPTFRKSYEAMFIMYSLGAQWGFAIIFSKSMSSYIPVPFLNNGETCESCNSLYVFYLALYAAFVVPLSFLNLGSQKYLQIAMTGIRVVSLILMIITSAYGLAHGIEPAGDDLETITSNDSSFPMFEVFGFGAMFPIVVFSNIAHSGLPTMVQPVDDHSKLRKTWTAIMATTFVLYSTLSTIVMAYYGPKLKAPCSLNWVDYDYREDQSGPRPALATFISYIVVLSPAVNTLSGYALGSITASGNIISGFNHSGNEHGGLSITKQRMIRVAVAVTPIGGAMLLSDISAIYSFTGLLSFVIAFLVPALLQVRSRTICEKIWGKEHPDTMFTGWMSRRWVIYVIATFSIFGMLTTVAERALASI